MTGHVLPHEIVEIGTAARLIKAGVFVDGQQIGKTPDGHPVYCRHRTLVVDMRSERE